MPSGKFSIQHDERELVRLLHARFEANLSRHPNLSWETVLGRLEASPGSLAVLSRMESTGGEPDVIALEENDSEIIFFDCAPESPVGRRSLCYDEPALEFRKKNKPHGSARAMADEIGASLLTEDEYRYLQTAGEFDLKTSSWLLTPDEIRELGGAIFGDRRFGRVFTYHNGAESYYASRGFRTCLRV